MKVSVYTIISNTVDIETLVKAIGLDRKVALESIEVEDDESKTLQEIVENLPYIKVVDLAHNLGYDITWVNLD